MGIAPIVRSRALLQPGLCRQDQLIPIELESPDQRQLSSRDSDRGVSHSLSIPACPASTSPQSPLTSQGSVSLRGGVLCSRTNNFHSQINNINNHKINVIYNNYNYSSVTCIHYKEAKSLLQKQVIQHLLTLPVRFYSNMFMVPKKGGGQRPVINLKYLNHFVKSEHFKMEGLHTVKTLLRKNDWMSNMPFHGTNSPPISQPPSLQSGARNLPIEVPSFRVVYCSQSVYQNPQASGGNAEVNWHTSSDIHRRHASDGILQQTAHRAGPLHPVPSRECRVYNQQQKVAAGPNTRNRISCDDNQLGEDGYVFQVKRSRISDKRHRNCSIFSDPQLTSSLN